MQRFAIYYTPPPATGIAREVAGWLGRDPYTTCRVGQPALSEISAERVEQITRAPRHYGFHGTLKPPFKLAKNAVLANLVEQLYSYAATRPAVSLGQLQLRWIDDFLALCPTTVNPALKALAADIVESFDTFRAASSPQELQRRRSGRCLTENQDRLLTTWGYPYVMEEFRFHLTLTGRITDPIERQTVHGELQRRLAPHLDQELALDHLALFCEYNGAPLRVAATFPMAGRLPDISPVTSSSNRLWCCHCPHGRNRLCEGALLCRND